jgi:BTB/POZ domain-containing protein KCTD8/12/16
MDNRKNQVIELNVGGSCYATSLKTLISEEKSYFHELFTDNGQISLKDSNNRIFIDRDGQLFRYILDYLRTKSLNLPENFNEKQRLKVEAEFYRLPSIITHLDSYYELKNVNQLIPINERTLSPSMLPARKSQSGYIVIGYRGTFAFGREGISDIKFRKISRILVCGRIQLCKDVFGDTLNESRDPDHGNTDRYTSRFYLKHTSLEQAFDSLNENGFFLVGTAATGTNSSGSVDNEETRWLHYNEFVFLRS